MLLKGISKSNSYDSEKDVCFILGDVFKQIKKIPDESINLIITSPPYNLNKEYEERKAFQTYLDEMNPLLNELKRVLKPNGSICWQVGNHIGKSKVGSTGEIYPLDIFYYEKFKDLNFQLRNRVIWHFRSGLHAQNRLSGRYETMLWFTKSDKYIFNLDDIRVPQKYQGKKYHKGKKHGQLSGNPKGMNPSDFWSLMDSEFELGLWDFPNVKANHPEKITHPCSYPIELVERCVLAFSEEGDTVLDPFAGVGTTILGAIMNDRKVIGCELSKEYMKVAKHRVTLLEKNELPYRKRGKPIAEASGSVAEKVFEKKNTDLF